MVRIYMAGRYGRREELKGYAARLKGLGCTVTSRWLDGGYELDDNAPDPALAARWAAEDLDDLHAADWLIAFTESPGPVQGRGRGGRHFEMGYALGMSMRVFVVGHRENVFCHLPEVEHFNDFDGFRDFLVSVLAESKTAF